MKKKFVSVVVLLILIMNLLPIAASATVVDSGKCGENATYTLNSDGLFTVSGYGIVDSSIEPTIRKYADSIKKVEIKGLRGTIIIYGDFRQCKSLESVVLNNVKSIGEYAFYNCPINSLTISGNLESIREKAFYGCNIKSLTIPGTVESIGDSAFSGCKDLESLTISEGVTEIGSFAFSNCDSLINVTIPASVTKLGGNVGFFGECIFSGNKLSDVNVSPNNAVYSSVDGVLFSKDKTVLYYYPDAKKESLYEIPEGVQTIESQAFWDREYLRKLIIPNSVKTIDDYAFSSSIQMGNKNLTDIYYKGAQEEWNALTQNDPYIPCHATIHYNAVGTAAPKIIGKPIVSGSTVTVNLSDVEYDSTLIAAVYSDGVLKNMQAAELSAGDMSKVINISASGNDTIKVFIWDSFDSMNPLCEAKSINM